MAIYELKPSGSQKSFNGKAIVEIEPNGDEILYSYGTKILTKHKDGSYTKHWDDWSATTGKHIASFAGLNKKQYEAFIAGKRGKLVDTAEKSKKQSSAKLPTNAQLSNRAFR